MDVKEFGRSCILLQEATYSSFSYTRVFYATVGARLFDFLKTLFNVLFKTFKNGFVFFPARSAAAQNKRFLSVGRGTILNVDAFMDGVPLFTQKLFLKGLQLAFGCSDDVASLALFQKSNVLIADHTAIQNPDAISSTVLAFNFRDNFLYGGTVMTIAVEYFVTQWNTFSGHHQSDQHLLAIRTLVS